MKKTVKPVVKDNYKTYVLATAVYAAVFGFFFGFALLLLALFFAYQPYDYVAALACGLLSSAVFGIWALVRESDKWDQHNLAETNEEPPRETMPKFESTKQNFYHLWRKNETGGLTAVCNFKLKQDEFLYLKMWLTALGEGFEKNFTRDRAIKHWHVKTAVYNTIRDAANDNGWVEKQGDNQNSPIIVVDAAAFKLAAERLGK